MVALFNLRRDSEQMEQPEAERRQGLLKDVQGRVRRRVVAISTRLAGRPDIVDSTSYKRLLEELPLAVSAMKKTERNLTEFDAGEALINARKALLHLQRGDSAFRDVQVALNRNPSQGGGEASQRQNELADLFSLEMDKLETPYENLRRAAGQQQQQQERDDLSRMLRELARRQQRELERQIARAMNRRADNSGSSAQREIKQELEALARKLEELSRKRRQRQEEQNQRQAKNDQSGARDDQQSSQAQRGRDQQSPQQESPQQGNTQAQRAASGQEQSQPRQGGGGRASQSSGQNTSSAGSVSRSTQQALQRAQQAMQAAMAGGEAQDIEAAIESARQALQALQEAEQGLSGERAAGDPDVAEQRRQQVASAAEEARRLAQRQSALTEQVEQALRQSSNPANSQAESNSAEQSSATSNDDKDAAPARAQRKLAEEAGAEIATEKLVLADDLNQLKKELERLARERRAVDSDGADARAIEALRGAVRTTREPRRLDLAVRDSIDFMLSAPEAYLSDFAPNLNRRLEALSEQLERAQRGLEAERAGLETNQQLRETIRELDLAMQEARTLSNSGEQGASQAGGGGGPTGGGGALRNFIRDRMQSARSAIATAPNAARLAGDIDALLSAMENDEEGDSPGVSAAELARQERLLVELKRFEFTNRAKDGTDNAAVPPAPKASVSSRYEKVISEYFDAISRSDLDPASR